MGKADFVNKLKKEIARIDSAGLSKRNEIIIEGFTNEDSPQAIIAGKNYRIFNSNDYLGLRFSHKLKDAESKAASQYGVGPGAVRFISGTLKIYRELEEKIAKFHGRDDAIVISSAFGANIGVLASLIKGQSRDTLIDQSATVLSDELNHRSIVEGIRVANLSSEQKLIFKHMDHADLEVKLKENIGKSNRVIVVTDGIFSMLGEYQDLKLLNEVISKYDSKYDEGILLVVDDAHGVGSFGDSGRGTEETADSKADVLVGTLGKAFGTDGGYVVANKTIIDYLRESMATYIYSNCISPGTAGAALEALNLVDSPQGADLLSKIRENIKYFKEKMTKHGFSFAADSIHPIQAVFIGDTQKTVELKKALYDQGILVTNINYPVVAKGKDEIRVQISAIHTKADLDYFVDKTSQVAKNLQII